MKIGSSQNTIRVVALLCGLWLIEASLNYLVLRYLNWSVTVSIFDGVTSATVLALSCLASINALKYYSPQQTKWLSLLLFSATVAFIATWITTSVLSWQIKLPDYQQDLLQRSFPIRLLFNFLTISWITLLTWLWKYIELQKEITANKQYNKELMRDSELYSLQQQLQPHFLFNSLNSINALIGSRPTEAREMVQQLSDFLRGTVGRGQQDLSSLENELAQINRYFQIEKVRFGHRLQTEINIPTDCKSCIIPALILQPIVENAIKFGLYDTLEAVTISVKANLRSNYLDILITNPFEANTQSKPSGTGFGLHAVNRRLYLLYGQPNLLTTSSKENIFTTTLSIPIKND